MNKTGKALWAKAQVLSQRADELFAERNTLYQQADQEKRSYQEKDAQRQLEIDHLKSQADALAAEFKRLYQASGDAYNAGEGGLAKGFSLQGRAIQAQCEAVNAQWHGLLHTLSPLKADIDALYQAAQERHQQAITCVNQAKELRAQVHAIQKPKQRKQVSDASIQNVARLLADERCHLIRKHTRQTAAELRQRCIEEPTHNTSSFTTRAIAEKIVSMALHQCRADINNWLPTDEDPLYVIYSGGKTIGYVITPTNSVLQPATRALIILRHDPVAPTGYCIVTGYPIL